MGGPAGIVQLMPGKCPFARIGPGAAPVKSPGLTSEPPRETIPPDT